MHARTHARRDLCKQKSHQTLLHNVIPLVLACTLDTVIKLVSMHDHPISHHFILSMEVCM